MKDGLTPKQAAFCMEYLQDLNASAAAVRAGYSPNGSNRRGSALLALPAVKARLAELMAERAAHAELDATAVLEKLDQIVTACMTADRWNPQAAIRGLELVGKHLGLWPLKLDRASATAAHVALEWQRPMADIVTPEDIDAEIERLESLTGGVVKN